MAYPEMVEGCVRSDSDESKAAELSKALPDQIHAAAQAIAHAELRLADILTRRATGEAVKASRLAVARMTLARTQRDAEDLQRILRALPALLEKA